MFNPSRRTFSSVFSERLLDFYAHTEIGGMDNQERQKTNGTIFIASNDFG